MSFAEGTKVPVERSRAEIESLLSKYGAQRFASGWDGGKAAVTFTAHGRMVRFVLPLPTKDDARVALRKQRKYRAFSPSASAMDAWVATENRRRWRCLLLAIKAKLEVVETGIATFEDEFMAHIMLPDGRDVGAAVSPLIERAYKTGSTPPMLLLASSK